MANSFDFALKADDQVSASIQRIDEAVKSMNLNLTKAQEGLKLGGQDSVEGLSKLDFGFTDISKNARDAVQYIGDMVPPLNMVVGLVEKYGGAAAKLGVVGAVGYAAAKGVAAVGKGLGDAAEKANALDVAAKNSAMSVENFSKLQGALQIVGAKPENASNDIEGWYKSFNDALQGRNKVVMAAMNQIQAPIFPNKHGTADVMRTIEYLSRIFPTQEPENQKTVADALGLDENGLALMRRGLELKKLLTKSEKLGLEVDSGTNDKLVDLNHVLNNLNAAWDGFEKRNKNHFYGAIASNNSIMNGLKSLTDDDKGTDSGRLRRMYGDSKFYETLGFSDKVSLEFGHMTDSLRKQYFKYYGPDKDENEQPINPFSTQYSGKNGKVDPNARSVRNNNPWNLVYAGQSGAVPETGVADTPKAIFPTAEDGVRAADRQLRLYFSGQSRAAHHQPLTTVRDIIYTASPPQDGNNTEAMIRNASNELGVNPNIPLGLDEPAFRAKFLHAVFDQEGNNPYTDEQIQQIIQGNKQTNTAPIVTNQPSVNYPNENASINANNINAPIYNTQEITNAIADALRNNKMQVDITLTNSTTGEKTTFAAKGGGKITTSMDYY